MKIITPVMKYGHYCVIYNVTYIDYALYMHDLNSMKLVALVLPFWYRWGNWGTKLSNTFKIIYLVSDHIETWIQICLLSKIVFLTTLLYSFLMNEEFVRKHGSASA